MKNVKLSLFVAALTLAIAMPTGVYAQGNQAKAKSQKNQCKIIKAQEVAAKYKYKDAKKEKINKNKCVKPECIKKAINQKIVISTEDKAAMQVKNAAIEKVEIANKVLQTTIKTNKAAVKVEIKRIKESKLTITPEAKATIDGILLTMKNEHKDELNFNCPIKEIKTDVEKLEVTPINAVVEPVIEIQKTDVEKLEVAPVNAVVEPAVEIQKTDVEKLEVTPINAVVEPVVEIQKTDVEKLQINPITTAIAPTVVVSPVTTVVQPTVKVEKTYIEKLQARLDNILIAYTTKNTKLTVLSDKILSVLNALKLIK